MTQDCTIFLGSEFRSKLWSRTSMTQDCKVFLRHELQAPQLSRWTLRSGSGIGVFALFPRTKKVRRLGPSRVRHWARSPAHGHRRLMSWSTWCLRRGRTIPTGGRMNSAAPGRGWVGTSAAIKRAGSSSGMRRRYQGIVHRGEGDHGGFGASEARGGRGRCTGTDPLDSCISCTVCMRTRDEIATP